MERAKELGNEARDQIRALFSMIDAHEHQRKLEKQQKSVPKVQQREESKAEMRMPFQQEQKKPPIKELSPHFTQRGLPSSLPPSVPPPPRSPAPPRSSGVRAPPNSPTISPRVLSAPISSGERAPPNSQQERAPPISPRERANELGIEAHEQIKRLFDAVEKIKEVQSQFPSVREKAEEQQKSRPRPQKLQIRPDEKDFPDQQRTQYRPQVTQKSLTHPQAQEISPHQAQEGSQPMRPLERAEELTKEAHERITKLYEILEEIKVIQRQFPMNLMQFEDDDPHESNLPSLPHEPLEIPTLAQEIPEEICKEPDWPTERTYGMGGPQPCLWGADNEYALYEEFDPYYCPTHQQQGYQVMTSHQDDLASVWGQPLQNTCICPHNVSPQLQAAPYQYTGSLQCPDALFER